MHNPSIKDKLKELGYDYENMTVEELRAYGISNPELQYDTFQAEKLGLSYGKYSALKAAGMLPTSN